VERKNAVFQDRMVKELRLRNISGRHQTNVLLEKFFLKELNRRFAIKPLQEADFHRQVPVQVSPGRNAVHSRAGGGGKGLVRALENPVAAPGDHQPDDGSGGQAVADQEAGWRSAAGECQRAKSGLPGTGQAS
jgi:hypothetical protein